MVQKQPAIRWGGEEIYILAYKLAPTCLLSHQQLPSRKGRLRERLIQKQTSDLLGQERARREICGRRAYHESQPLRGVCWSRLDQFIQKRREEVIEEADVVAGHGVIKELDYQTLLGLEKDGVKYVIVMLNQKTIRLQHREG